MFPRYIYFNGSKISKNVQEMYTKDVFCFSEVRMHYMNHFTYDKRRLMETKSSVPSFSFYQTEGDELDEDEIFPFPLH